MDDHTKNTLDDLAGLFLTDPPAAGPAPVAADPLAGPASIKLPPKVAAPPSFGPSLTDEPDDPLLALLTSAENPPALPPVADVPSPSLRWTGHDQVDLTNPPRTAGPLTGVAQAVILGNLPGLAGPWLTQYAQQRAQHHARTTGAGGAVVILHLDGDQLDLELIEPTDRPAGEAPADAKPSPPALRIPPGGFGDRDLIDVLDQLLRTGATPVRTILLHLDPATDTAARLTDISDWTLLSGADDAAVVAGYRLLKHLLEQNARARVGLMVLGSDADTSRRAADKLHQAVDSFLHTPLTFVGHQQRMIPSRCRTLGTFTGVNELWPRLVGWLGQLQAPAAQPSPARPTATATPEPTAPTAPTAPSGETPRARNLHRGFAPLKPPVEVRIPDAIADPPPAAHAPFSDAGSGPSDADFGPLDDLDLDLDPDTGGDFDAPPEDINLFSLIDTDPRVNASIPGGLALEARCPSQPHTQLALDANGRLHLLHRHDSADGDPPTPREAIVELVAVRTWARQHRQLLQLTERGRRFDPDADPVLHLFTDRADLSVQLVARLGDLLKLHLLRDVTIGDQHTWFSTPLSA